MSSASEGERSPSPSRAAAAAAGPPCSLLAPAALPLSGGAPAAGGASGAPGAPAPPALDKRRLRILEARRQKKGVVYMSRVPPNMRPPKVRHLLSQYASIGRIYLAAEDPAATKARRKGAAGGGAGAGTGRRSKRFTEGWVEFDSKAAAKATAAALNGQPIGGPPRATHRHDLWTLRYLSGFKWEHLTEEVAYQNAVREQRLAAEAGAAARERDFYVGRVGAARAAEAQAARRAKREAGAAAAAAAGEGGGSGAPPPAPGPAPPPAIRRTFAQKPTVGAKGRVGGGSGGGGSGGGGGGLSRAALALIAGGER